MGSLPWGELWELLGGLSSRSRMLELLASEQMDAPSPASMGATVEPMVPLSSAERAAALATRPRGRVVSASRGAL